MYKKFIQAQALILLFLLPFERLPSFDLGGITIRLSSVLLVVALATSIPWLWKQGRLFVLSGIDKAVLAYYGVGWLSVLVASDQMRSMQVMGFFSVVLVGYLLISRTFRAQFSRIQVENIVITAGVLTAVFGLYQFVGNSYFNLSSTYTGLAEAYEKGTFAFARVQSVGLEPLYYANFLLLPIFILLARMLGRGATYSRTDWLSLLIIGTAFILALSRGAYLAILAGALVIIVMGLLRRVPWQAWVAPAGVAVIALMTSFALVEMVPPGPPSPGGQSGSGGQNVSQFTDHVAASESTRIASVNPRLETYREASRLFEQKPFLGVGIGNFGVVGDVSDDVETHGYKIVNNQYLETLAETGVAGFLALLAVIVLVIGKLVQVLRAGGDWFAIALLATVIGIGTQYNFFSTVYILFVWVVIGLVDALPIAPARQRTS